MSVKSCYKCTENLCTLVLDCNGDGTIDIPYNVTVDGAYKLVLLFKAKRIIFVEDFEVGDMFTFEVSELNENYCYQFHIETINGTILDFNGINNFRICTTQEYTSQII